MTTPRRKGGTITNAEKEFIQKNAASMTVRDMAARLNRTTTMVQEYVDRHYAPAVKAPPPKGYLVDDPGDPAALKKELRASGVWRRLKQELTQEELAFFDEEYVKMMGQFKGDVLATEESQIFDAIKLEILKSRNMVERRRAVEDIRRMEQERDAFLANFTSPAQMKDKDRQQSLQYEQMIQASRAAEQSRTSEYDKLQQRKDAIMKTLKGTRDQRVKEIESAKENILGLFKALQERQVQARESRETLLMDMAAVKEYQRLGQPHVYEDGKEDRPVLNAETVAWGGEEEKEEDAPEDGGTGSAV